jgi:protein-tyrosine phosphatase
LPAIEILVVCTANQCRSPMAAALLRARVPTGVTVSSAGLLPGGAPATRDARRVVDGVDAHVSRQLSSSLVDGAALVIAMERRHVREVAVASPDALARTFTLREFVRRASSVGPRRVAGGESFDEWLDRVGAGRRIADLVGDDPADDVADPIGQPLAVYRATAAELSDLLDRLVALAWPGTRPTVARADP